MAEHSTLNASNVKSLVWYDDGLIDWAGGGTFYALDGTTTRSGIYFAYRFDAATISDDGTSVVIYERFGTKGLVFRDGEVLREIDRSYYHAHMFEFPVCLWIDAEGDTLLAHCPNAYNRIEFENLDSGASLTAAADRKPSDFFQSRLQVNPAGSRLLSADWIWHPIDAVRLFDISAALDDPNHLDIGDILDLTQEGREFFALPSACWQTDDIAIFETNSEEDHEEALRGDPDAQPYGLIIYDVAARKIVRSVPLAHRAGMIMPVGDRHVVTFFEHPRLISLADGAVVDEWPDPPCGKQESSICGDKSDARPPVALDPRNRRFALLKGSAIHIISF